MKQFRISILLK